MGERNAIINGVAKNGIHVARRTEETFSDLKTIAGEYLQTWFEYLPEEVLNNHSAGRTRTADSRNAWQWGRAALVR